MSPMPPDDIIANISILFYFVTYISVDTYSFINDINIWFQPITLDIKYLRGFFLST